MVLAHTGRRECCAVLYCTVLYRIVVGYQGVGFDWQSSMAPLLVAFQPVYCCVGWLSCLAGLSVLGAPSLSLSLSEARQAGRRAGSHSLCARGPLIALLGSHVPSVSNFLLSPSTSTWRAWGAVCKVTVTTERRKDPCDFRHSPSHSPSPSHSRHGHARRHSLLVRSSSSGGRRGRQRGRGDTQPVRRGGAVHVQRRARALREHGHALQRHRDARLPRARLRPRVHLRVRVRTSMHPSARAVQDDPQSRHRPAARHLHRRRLYASVPSTSTPPPPAPRAFLKLC